MRIALYWMLWVGAIMYSVMENNYFGWNATAQSDAELLANGFQVALFSLAAGFTLLEIKR